jgi:ribonuclease BN (tRNA processing enzyme)
MAAAVTSQEGPVAKLGRGRHANYPVPRRRRPLQALRSGHGRRRIFTVVIAGDTRSNENVVKYGAGADLREVAEPSQAAG